MYCALYRKYRPHTFEDVVGQDVIVKTLKNSIINNKINHAYLFSGPRGSGKTSVAKILAQTVNCFSPNGVEICGECVFCTQQKQGQPIDIIEIDAASNNGVDEIREINNKVNLVPAVGKYKVYIIDEVHMLTIGAFNALLKTLEEPPSHVIFILATTDPHKVPTTILSRCQRFDFKKISETNIYNRIKMITEKENIMIDDDAILEIARLGDGSLRDSLSILDQIIAYAEDKITIYDVHDVNGSLPQKEIQELVKNVLKNDYKHIFEKIEDYTNKGKNISKIIDEILLYFRNLLILKNAKEYFNDNYDINLYDEISREITTEKLSEYINILIETSSQIRKNNNPKILLELCLIKMTNTKKEITIKENKDIVEKPIEQEKKVIVTKTDVVENVENSSKKVKNKPITKKIANNELDDFRKNRINNILSNFIKKTTMEIKQKLEKATDYLFDEKYGKIASIILDGELKAASDWGLIFLFKNENLCFQFVENIIEIESFIENILETKYNVISSFEDEWEIIKENFNKDKSSFTFKEETEDLNTIIQNIKTKITNSDDITNTFGDIVEYN